MINPVQRYDQQMEDAKEMVLQAAFLLSDAQLRIAKLKASEEFPHPVSRFSWIK